MLFQSFRSTALIKGANKLINSKAFFFYTIFALELNFLYSSKVLGNFSINKNIKHIIATTLFLVDLSNLCVEISDNPSIVPHLNYTFFLFCYNIFNRTSNFLIVVFPCQFFRSFDCVQPHLRDFFPMFNKPLHFFSNSY